MNDVCQKPGCGHSPDRHFVAAYAPFEDNAYACADCPCERYWPPGESKSVLRRKAIQEGELPQ